MSGDGLWVDDRVYGYVKVNRVEHIIGCEVENGLNRLQIDNYAEGDWSWWNGKAAKVHHDDNNTGNISVSFADGTIQKEVPKSGKPGVFEIEVEVHSERDTFSLKVPVKAADSIFTVLDRIRDSLRSMDASFVQLFSGEKVLRLIRPPEVIAPTVDHIIQIDFTNPGVEKPKEEKIEEPKTD